jgi:hypothetical protein
MERRTGGSVTQRTLKALGRYGPAELVADYTGGEYVLVGEAPGREPPLHVSETCHIAKNLGPLSR